ncbi:hypothetical protein [Vitiosangium sp. GDMCC 1.1324]|uniref:hypothetical protein n=1 Tax=Vitiosangium sp. (strain GDMCC 1.1324) TaxID=2138576 RepID=UPI000D33A8B6|nr:hypothetical protein [Vitiosangium sp. GDMCC 1.1324]PTL78854.1 hypothetical protein DAT35_38025 [Vitiosangium sp. GDMCC 1.1324]
MIRALEYLRKKFPQRAEIRKCAAYFRKHRHRMNDAALKKRGPPIGSGVVEAACKTLVSQRLKLSGMRWGRGAQAILNARGWDQNEHHGQIDDHRSDVMTIRGIVVISPPSLRY